jgi:hypothetical protein
MTYGNKSLLNWSDFTYHFQRQWIIGFSGFLLDLEFLLELTMYISIRVPDFYIVLHGK